MKKILAALLMLVMRVMLAASAMAAGPEIYVGKFGMASGEYLANGATAPTTTEPSGGYAYYKDGVLTLKDYVYSGIGHAKALVYVPYASHTEIVLLGTNSITTTVAASDVNCGINSQNGSIAISGSGSLVLETKGDGVVSANEITISGGTLNVNVEEEGIRAKGDFSITGGKLNVTSGDNGIHAENMKIGGGTVVVHSLEYGINLPFGNASVTGGELNVTAAQRGLSAQSVTIGSGMAVKASTAQSGALGEYVATDLNKYKRIVIKAGATVTFDSDGGSAVAEQIVFKGDKVTKPADPTRSGYTFKGWTLGGAAYDFTDAVTGDIKLKAVWEKKVDIWVGGVGAPCCVKQVNHLVVADDPIEELYLYNGWEHEDKETGYMNRPCCAFITTKDGQIFEAYEPVTLEGFADAYSDPIVAVEISMDRGATWTTYPTENTNDNIWTHWTYTFTPQEGAYVLMARAVTASGRVSETPDTLLINAQ